MDWAQITVDLVLIGVGYVLALLFHWPSKVQKRDSQGRFSK